MEKPIRLIARCSHPAIPEKADRETWLKILKQIDSNLSQVAEYALKNSENAEDSMLTDALFDARTSSLRGRLVCKGIIAGLRHKNGRGDAGPLIPRENLESLKREYNSVFGDILRTILLEQEADNLLRELPSIL